MVQAKLEAICGPHREAYLGRVRGLSLGAPRGRRGQESTFRREREEKDAVILQLVRHGPPKDVPTLYGMYTQVCAERGWPIVTEERFRRYLARLEEKEDVFFTYLGGAARVHARNRRGAWGLVSEAHLADQVRVIQTALGARTDVLARDLLGDYDKLRTREALNPIQLPRFMQILRSMRSLGLLQLRVVSLGRGGRSTLVTGTTVRDPSVAIAPASVTTQSVDSRGESTSDPARGVCKRNESYDSVSHITHHPTHSRGSS